MSVDSREIDLIIRANNQSKQTLDGVGRSIKELSSLIDQQGDASKRGAVGIDELKATVLSLQQAQDRLKSSANIVSQFDKSGEAAIRASERVRKAQENYDKYASSTKDQTADGGISEKRAARLAALQASLERAQRTEANRAATNEKLREQVRLLEVDETNLAATENKLRETAAELGLSIGRAAKNVSEYTANLRAAKEAAAELAAEQARIASSAAAEKGYKELLAQRAAQEEAALKARQEADIRVTQHTIQERRKHEQDYVNWWINAEEQAYRRLFEIGEAELTRRAAQLKEEQELERLHSQALIEDAKRTAQAQAKEMNLAHAAALKEDAARAKAAAALAAEAAKRDGIAQRAEQDASALSRLAASATRALPPIQGLFQNIRGLVDPAAQARQTLGGLEGVITTLSASIANIKGPIKGYQTTLQDLRTAQKAVMDEASRVDAWRAQLTAVKNARTEFSRARADVTAYAAAIRASTGPDEILNQKLREAQTRLAAAAKEMKSTTTSASAMREQLRAAGIETNNLGAAEKRLTEMAQTNTRSVKELTAAYEKYGVAVNRASSEHFRFGDSGRTTLSLLQRIRGEVLALTAGYVGLMGVMELVHKINETINETNSIKNKLSVAADGDPKKTAAEYEYILGLSQHYGKSLNTLAEQYAKYAVAAHQANLSDQQRHYIFEQLTAGLTVFGANGARVEKGLQQFNEMIDIGHVQMQHLKAMIVDMGPILPYLSEGLARLGIKGFPPIVNGAVDAQKATQALFHLMKTGSLDANTAMYAMATEMEKQLGKQLPAAINSLAAAQGRYQTDMLLFRKQIADSGFEKAEIEFYKTLHGLMNGSDGGKKFAQNISDGLVDIIKLFEWILQNKDAIAEGLKLIAEAWGAKTVLQFGLALGEGIKKLKELYELMLASEAIGALKKAFVLLNVEVFALGRNFDILAKEKLAALFATTGRLSIFGGAAAALGPIFMKMATMALQALALVTAAIAGWEIGQMLNEKFESVREFGVALVFGFEEVWERLRYNAGLAGQNVADAFSHPLDRMINSSTENFRNMLGVASWAAKALGGDGASSKIDNLSNAITIGPEADTKAARDKLDADHKARMAQIAKDKDYAITGASDEYQNMDLTTPVAVPKKAFTPTARPDRPTPGEEVDKGAAKRANQIQEIENELAAMHARIDRKDADSLASRMKAYEEQYNALMAKIRKLGGAEGARFEGEAKRNLAELKVQEAEKYNGEIEKQHKVLLSKLDDADVRADKKSSDTLTAKIAKMRDGYEELLKELDDFEKKVRGNGKSDEENGDQLSFLHKARYRLGLDETKETTAISKADGLEQLAAREKVVNDLLAARKALLDTIKIEEDDGQISHVEALNKNKQIIDDMQPQIEAAAQSTIDFARNMSDLDPSKLEEVDAKMTLAANSAAKLKTELITTAQVNTDIAGGLTTSISTLAQGIAKAAREGHGLGDAFTGAWRAFGKFSTDFMIQIAEMIIKAQILAALQSSPIGGAISGAANAAGGVAGGGGAGWGSLLSGAGNLFSSWLGAGAASAGGAAASIGVGSAAIGTGVADGFSFAALLHDGGIAGSGSDTQRQAHSSWFSNAPRYHTGGIAGLSPDEYPAILKRNEEILTDKNPRNILNGGAAAGGQSSSAAPQAAPFTLINAIDSASVLDHALSQPAGHKVLLNHFKANKTAYKTLLG